MTSTPAAHDPNKMAVLRRTQAVFSVLLVLFVSPLPCHNVPAYQKPVMVQQTGKVLPKPQMLTVSAEAYTLAMSGFKFTYGSSSQMCDIVDQAFRRYYDLIFVVDGVKKAPVVSKDMSELTELQIMVKEPCTGVYPSLESSENYTLTVAAPMGTLVADSAWGVLRGLETFSQLVYRTDDGMIIINKTTVDDFPRFAHRGILLDTSRHFIPIKYIKQNLDAMAYNKFNVFHWHIVDDPSFPYQSVAFPDLSAKGAFNPYTHLYTQEDVKDVIEYSRLRGIRVVPEFDTPGHTASWGAGLPGFLTPCYDGSAPNGKYYAANPMLNTTYDYMTKLLQEIKDVFPDKYVHLGGDEVSFNCWKSNPDITKFMEKMGFGTDYSKLEEYYIKNILDITTSVGRDYIVWQEVLDNGVQVAKDTVVEVWRRKPPVPTEMARVTAKGLRAILSSCWYLNRISYGVDWGQYYTCEPLNFTGTQAQKDLVIGGEACMWGEYVDGTNLIARLWPRASAVAERLWSNKDVTSMADATVRMDEQRCRMVRRGLNAEPLHPGFCQFEYD
ncbi:HEXA [Branchiostoma lanceolatum]|uniref:Beta-hexosaminidase n=1 Tax=Branchiostoma lanceolatum TaxID=7740 RepID=A0A8K0ELF2_BRALA|nr:HEXA [Branchiostoma lanceolatum]